MSKKLYFLISFVLVLSLAGSASAQTFWTDGSGDHLWCNPGNWDNGLPEFNPDITSWETRGIDAGINIENMTDPVLIGPGCDAEAAWVGVGYPVNTGPGVGLNMTGGTFSAMEIALGECDGGFGWMTMSGGTVDFVDYGYLAVGSNGGEGRLDMTGGTMNLLGKEFLGSPVVWAGCIRLPKNEGKCEGNPGVGHIQLDGGTINTRILVMADNGTMDITGGAMTIHDDQAMVDFYLGGPNTITDYINDWIADGNLTAYGGNGIVGVAYIETPDLNEPNEVWIAGRLSLGAAWLPLPFDGAIDILRDVVLRWLPGDYVQAVDGHKLYFADNFTDVNSRLVTPETLTDPCYSAGTLETLELAKTYYWAVDEVNGATTWPGPVWRFTMDRGVAYDPDPPDEAEDVNSRALTLSWLPGIDANDVNGHEVYFGTSWAEVNSATTATTGIYRGPDDVLGPDGNDRYSYVIPGGDLPFALGEAYFWRIDEVNGTNTWKGDIWSFIVEGRAKAVYPADEAGNIPALNLILRWEAGTGSDGHDVYFGSDEAAVEDANTNTAGIYRGPPTQSLADVNYLVPEDLEVGKAYYWRIDEVNVTGGTFVKGDAWSFTTGSFLIVDSFEWYQTHQELRDVWKDSTTGTIPNNKAELFVESADANKFLDTGEQSMRFYYRNMAATSGAGCTAEANLPLEVGTDWTVGGVKALVVNFCGDTDNGQEDHRSYTLANDRLWLSLVDGGSNEGIMRLPDMNDVIDGQWHTWNISLLDPNFSGVDMNNVAKVYIGFGGVKGEAPSKYGAGYDDLIGDTVWFDDISLYPPRCMPELTGIDTLYSLGDFTEDCNTDYFDLEIMARDWNMRGMWAQAGMPGIDPIIEYLFDEGSGTTAANTGSYTTDPNYDITLGLDRDGNVDPNCDPEWEYDPCNPDRGWYMRLDGGSEVNEYSDTDYLVFSALNFADPGINHMSITAWIKRGVGEQADGYTGLVHSRDYDEVLINAGLTFGGGAGGKEGWGWNGQVGYGWVEDAGCWGYHSELYIPEEEWAFCAVVVKPDSADLYMSDGNELWAATNVFEHPPELWEVPIEIGSDLNRGGERSFRGAMDDVRIYDYALTAGEIMGLAGVEGIIYVPLKSVADIVVGDKDPCYPTVDDQVDFEDYTQLAKHWLETNLWP